MKKVALILILLAVSLSCPALTVHRALVIGLGKQLDPTWRKINGDNDIAYVMNYLTSAGYTDIRTLRNEQATKEGIVRELRALADRCGEGDKVYIHYSGHGQLVTDLNGDEARRWSGWHAQCDESWVPYDAYMYYCEQDRGEKHLTDDELAEYLTMIRNKVGRRGDIVVVIDSCHSGDATCGPEEEIVRGVDTVFNIPMQGAATADEEPLPERWLTVSACRPYQLSAEIKDLRVGKLTYALYRLGFQTLHKSARDIEEEIGNFMQGYRGRLPQTPMVSGKR